VSIGKEEEITAYRLVWGKDPPYERKPIRPEIGAPVPVRLPLQENKLEQEWQFARDRIELLIHRHGLPVGSYIYHPYLESLEILILKAWDVLGTPQVFAACLTLIENMSEDAVATALAYEELKVALGLGGDYWLPIEVAARQLQYLKTSPIWQSVERRDGIATEVGDANGAREAPGETD
jgi:hypothetical protein